MINKKRTIFIEMTRKLQELLVIPYFPLSEANPPPFHLLSQEDQLNLYESISILLLAAGTSEDSQAEYFVVSIQHLSPNPFQICAFDSFFWSFFLMFCHFNEKGGGKREKKR